jgi:RNA polymerase sigma-70 factor (ECF subfamily)
VSERPEPECEARSAFEELFLEHYPRLVRTLIRLVGNTGQAEELAAEAFCRLYRHRGKAGPDENLPGWLYRTAVNLGLDALRANSRRSRREQMAHYRDLQGAAASSGLASAGPLSELLAEEQRERVRGVLALLRPVYGQVLLMGSSGFTGREIADFLGMKPDSLYVLISRAKAQFEKQYVTLYGRAQ